MRVIKERENVLNKLSKLQKILWIVLVAGIGGLSYSVVRAVRMSTKSEGSFEEIAAYSIYIPSPVERAALQQIKSLWPDTFHSERPLTASKLPLFYNQLFDDPKRVELGLSATQLAMVRSWSIDANTASLELLKRELLAPIDEVFRSQALNTQALAKTEPSTLAQLLKQSRGKDEAECSLFYLERLFRIGQVWPKFQKESAAKYNACVGPNDLLSVWFDLNQLLFVNSPKDIDPKMRDSIGARLTTLAQKGSPVDAYLAARLSQAAFLKSAHHGQN